MFFVLQLPQNTIFRLLLIYLHLMVLFYKYLPIYNIISISCLICDSYWLPHMSNFTRAFALQSPCTYQTEFFYMYTCILHSVCL